MQTNFCWCATNTFEQWSHYSPLSLSIPAPFLLSPHPLLSCLPLPRHHRMTIFLSIAPLFCMHHKNFLITWIVCIISTKNFHTDSLWSLKGFAKTSSKFLTREILWAVPFQICMLTFFPRDTANRNLLLQQKFMPSNLLNISKFTTGGGDPNSRLVFDAILWPTFNS